MQEDLLEAGKLYAEFSSLSLFERLELFADGEGKLMGIIAGANLGGVFKRAREPLVASVIDFSARGHKILPFSHPGNNEGAGQCCQFKA